MKKLKVETEFGTFTRTTNRTYTHLVIYRIAESTIRRQYAERLDFDKKTLARYESDIAAGRLDGFPIEKWQGWILDLRAKIERTPFDMQAAIEKNRRDGFLTAGWCGRPDLAAKLAETKRREGGLDVTIVPVVR